MFKNSYDEHGKNVENILWKDASYRIDVLIFLFIEAKPLIINKKPVLLESYLLLIHN